MEIPSINIATLMQVQIKERPVISPSKFTYLKNGCIGQECLQLKLKKSFPGLNLPGINQSSLQGTVLHELMNKYSDENNIDLIDFKSEAENIFQKEKDRIYESWPMIITDKIKLDYNKVFNLYSNLTFNKPKSNQIHTNYPKVYREYIIDCGKTLGLKGKLDYLLILGKHAIIKDYKSGRFLDEIGTIKKEYIEQLSLYELLVTQKFPLLENVKLLLEDFDGNDIEVVSAGKDYLLREVDEIRTKIEASLSSPNEKGYFLPSESCRFCNCKHICSFTQWNDPLPNEYFDFIGIISVNEDRIDFYDKNREITLELLFDFLHQSLLYELKRHEGERLFIGNVKLIQKELNKWYGKCTEFTIAIFID